MTELALDTEGADPLMLAGVNDRNMHEVSRLFGVRVVLRGNHLVLTGDLSAVERSVPVVQHMVELARLRAPFDTTDIARFAAPDAPLGINTSAIPIARFAALHDDPARVVGMHFMNPAPLKDMVEVIAAPQTSPETLKRARALLASTAGSAALDKDSN